MKKSVSILMGLLVMIFLINFATAAEHPGEHPGEQMSEHPDEPSAESMEHPGKEAVLSAGDIISGIKSHISEVTQANAGYYPINDEQESKDLKLALVKIHEDKVSYIKKDDAYFACTDFITNDGSALYDVDFWMKKGEDGNLSVYQVKIHKKDGQPRFTYQDDEIALVE